MIRMLYMREQDLLELYQLTSLYKRTYPEDVMQNMEELLEMVSLRYRETTNGKNIKGQTNPRKAGRKPTYTEEVNQKIIGLHHCGVSLRGITKEIGCSLGHVQNIIQQEKRG